MLDSVLGIFSGTLSTNKGFSEEVNEAPENKEIRNSEGVEYSEADLERIETAADIMGEIFTDEVISNWENLSVEERTAYLNEYYAQAGQALGIDTKGVYVADLYEMYGYGTQGVNRGDGYLGIDIRLVADSSQLGELLNITTHEMRHQLQTDALRNSDAFPDIPQETLEQWEYEFTNYIDPSYDFEGYQSQAIETDARAFAEETVDEYLSDAGHDTYAMAKHEAEPLGTEEQAADGLEALPTPADAPPEDAEGADDGSAVSFKGNDGLGEGLGMDAELNKATFSFTHAQCARASTGTQNYCPFTGSGR